MPESYMTAIITFNQSVVDALLSASDYWLMDTDLLQPPPPFKGEGATLRRPNHHLPSLSAPCLQSHPSAPDFSLLDQPCRSQASTCSFSFPRSSEMARQIPSHDARLPFDGYPKPQPLATGDH